MSYYNLWLGPLSKKYPCAYGERGRGERTECSRPDLPVYIMRYEDLYRDSKVRGVYSGCI